MMHWEGFTAGWPPSGGDTVWENARLYHPIDIRLPHERRHPLIVTAGSGGRLLRVSNSTFRHHLLISFGIGGGSVYESGSARAEEDDEVAK